MNTENTEPVEDEVEANNNENKGEKKDEVGKPEPQKAGIKFLDPAEQVKVQKILQYYSKAGKGTDAAVQTPTLEPLKCDCKELLNTVNIKLDKILAVMSSKERESNMSAETFADPDIDFPLFEPPDLPHATTTQSPSSVNPPPKSTQSPSVPNNTLSVSLDSSISKTPSPMAATSSFVTEINSSIGTTPSSVNSTLSSSTLTPASLSSTLEHIPPPLTSVYNMNAANPIFEDTFKESSSLGNYAKNLVFKFFEKDELRGSNCVGAKGKRALEADQRMQLVKDAVFRKYFVDDKKKSWAICRKAIDCAIRHNLK